MCGRFSQREQTEVYASRLNWTAIVEKDLDERLRYNVPPGTRPLVLHRLGDGEPHVDRLFWGYKPEWSKRGAVSNARLDTIMDGSPFWRGPVAHGRVIVPMDGWFEWTGEKGDKQPWYINPKDHKPILIAAIAGWTPDDDADAAHGMAIVTDDAAGGMVDIHDRRPVCLTVHDAKEWLDPDTSTDTAKEILAAARPESVFQWWEVTREMGNSKYQKSDASEPIKT